MITKKKKRKSFILPLSIFLIGFYISIKFMTGLENSGGTFSMELLNKVSDDVFKFWLPISFSPKNLAVSLFIAFLCWGFYECLSLQNKENIQENTYGSAEWQDSKVLEKKKDKEIENNVILTATEQVSKNMKKSGMNRHILITGRPGTGKSRYFFKPNILNATGSLVITDPKGELLRDCGANLIRKGYSIKVFNLDNMAVSNHYNPFVYIRKKYKTTIDKRTGKEYKKLEIQQDDVMALIDCIMRNTKSDQIETQTGDPFWEKAEMLFLQSLVYYMLEEFKDRPLKINFTTLLSLMRLSTPDDKGRNELDKIFDKFEEEYTEEHIAIKQYKHFKVASKSPKMMSTIIMTATARLSCFNIDEIATITNDDNMELDRIGMPTDLEKLKEINERPDNIRKSKNGKIAIFIVTKPSRPTFNFLATLMYTQLFQQIDENAIRCGGELATPLDMYMDEFRQQGQIPQFQEMLAYVRGLNVGIVICLQSLSQLKEFYKDTWENILDCCDTIMLIGSNSKDTNEYFSTLLGDKTWYKKSSGRTFSKQGSSSQNWDITGRKLAFADELARMQKGYCLLWLANIGPFFSKLYDLSQHPEYKYIYEPWNKEKTDQYKYIHNPNELTDKPSKIRVLETFKELIGTEDITYAEPPVNVSELSLDDFQAIDNGDVLIFDDFVSAKTK